MPNIKSAKKRVKVNAVKALNNQMAKSELKTTLKKFDAAMLPAIRRKRLLLIRLPSRLSIRRLPSTSCIRTTHPTRRAR